MAKGPDYTILRDSNARKEVVTEQIEVLINEAKSCEKTLDKTIEELQSGGFSPLSRYRIFDFLTADIAIRDSFDRKIEQMVINIAFGKHSGVKSLAQGEYVKLCSNSAIEHAMKHCNSSHLVGVKYKTSQTRLHAEVAFSLLSRHGERKDVMQLFVDSICDEESQISNFAFEYFPVTIRDLHYRTISAGNYPLGGSIDDLKCSINVKDNFIKSVIDYLHNKPYRAMKILASVEVDGENGLLRAIEIDRKSVISAVNCIQIDSGRREFWERCVRRNICASVQETWQQSVSEITNGFLPKSIKEDLIDLCPDLIKIAELSILEMIELLEIIESNYSDIDRQSDEHIQIQNLIIEKVIHHFNQCDFNNLGTWESGLADYSYKILKQLSSSEIFTVSSQNLIESLFRIEKIIASGVDLNWADPIFAALIRFTEASEVESLVEYCFHGIESNTTIPGHVWKNYWRIVGRFGSERDIPRITILAQFPIGRWKSDFWPSYAIDAIGKIGGESAFEVLAYGLHTDEMTRLNKISSSFNSGKISALDFLLKVALLGYPFEDEESRFEMGIRLNACWVLGSIGERSWIGEINEAMAGCKNEFVKKHLSKSVKCIEGNRDLLKHFYDKGANDASFTAEFYMSGANGGDDFDGHPGPLR